ncbi:MAG: thiosulfate oxidation carrier complex protein SoxZ [Hyphomicrobiaceae bacterium]|nr:thiosulfate oxidation carrier complex protein SoxZ [Hyphomicrobiaceae bacterium]
MARARIVMAKSARRGDVVEIKTLVPHAMESGFRRDAVGKPVPRHIITSLAVTYAGAEVFRMEMFPAIAANPYVMFATVATETADVVFTWTDDRGGVMRETRRLEVT